MGTMLYGKGYFLNVCYDELNVKQPRLVQEVHEAYVRAGAEVLETNTFGANPLKLATYGPSRTTRRKSTKPRLSWLGPLRPGRPAWSAPSGHSACGSSRSARPPGSTRSEHFQGARRTGCLGGGVDGFHPRDLLGRRGDPRGAPGGAVSVRPAHRGADDHPGTDGLTRTAPRPRSSRRTARRVRCRRDRRELLSGARRTCSKPSRKIAKVTDRPTRPAQRRAPHRVGDRTTCLASPVTMATYAPA